VTQEIIDRVKAISDSILISEGMDLVEVEFRREAGGWVLRLTLDKSGGVTLDDCTRMSREIGRSLDVEDFIENPYHLEVSSPGLDRSLKNERDFIRFSERRIKVKTMEPIGKQKSFKGKLLKCVEGRIEMETDGGIVEIPLPNIARANLEVEF
jgi:ribosome maturation factor RimP